MIVVHMVRRRGRAARPGVNLDGERRRCMLKVRLQLLNGQSCAPFGDTALNNFQAGDYAYYQLGYVHTVLRLRASAIYAFTAYPTGVYTTCQAPDRGGLTGGV